MFRRPRVCVGEPARQVLKSIGDVSVSSRSTSSDYFGWVPGLGVLGLGVAIGVLFPTPEFGTDEVAGVKAHSLGVKQFEFRSARARDADAARSTATVPTPVGPVLIGRDVDDEIPDRWRHRPGGIRVVDPSPIRFQLRLAEVNRALEKYPANSLRSVLRRVVVVGQLEMQGVGVAGTWSRDGSVFVSDEVESRRLSSEDFERVLHAEISSIVIVRQQVNLRQFETLNGHGFEYGSGGVHAIRGGRASTESRAEWLAQGFINQYAKSSAENDFNQIAGWVMMRQGNAEAHEALYPVLGRKMRFVQRVYSRAFPGMERWLD